MWNLYDYNIFYITIYITPINYYYLFLNIAKLNIYQIIKVFILR